MAVRGIFSNGDLDRLRTRLAELPVEVESDVSVVMEEAAQQGAAQMKQFIATRGTGWVGNGPRATPEGRIDYGTMIDSVSGHVEHSPTKVTAEFGWLDNERDYFLYQENGFQDVSPMHALLDSFIRTREIVRQRLRVMLK